MTSIECRLDLKRTLGVEGSRQAMDLAVTRLERKSALSGAWIGQAPETTIYRHGARPVDEIV
jgi:hypothetical protein